MPEKLELPASGQLDAWDEFGFLDECDMTLREFCKVHDLPYPAEEEEFHIRPARPDEAGLFYVEIVVPTLKDWNDDLRREAQEWTQTSGLSL